MRLLLDTHILVWWLQGTDELSQEQTEALERAEGKDEKLAVATITLWEIAKLIERGRLELRYAADVFFDELESHARLAFLPINSRIALESTRLGPTFHRDPADQVIVATARVHALRLVTADDRIRRSRVVPVV